MRGGVAGGLVLAWALGELGALGCRPSYETPDWTCDFDAHEPRPLSEPDATAGPDGALPVAVCQETCGPPASSCSFTLLDGGLAGAVCPVCTF